MEQLSKRYKKAHDIFIRELAWSDTMLLAPKDSIEIHFDYRATFDENIKAVKNSLNLTEEETKNLDIFRTEFEIHQCEKTKYEHKGILEKNYGYIWGKQEVPAFLDRVKYFIEKIKEIDKNFDTENFHGENSLLLLLEGISFEYICKALLLSKGYTINQHELDNAKGPIKIDSLEVINFSLLKTFSIDIIWEFIKSKKIISLTEDEILIGNWLVFIRNTKAHVPLSPSNRGGHVTRAISLINKIMEESKPKP